MRYLLLALALAFPTATAAQQVTLFYAYCSGVMAAEQARYRALGPPRCFAGEDKDKCAWRIRSMTNYGKGTDYLADRFRRLLALHFDPGKPDSRWPALMEMGTADSAACDKSLEHALEASLFDCPDKEGKRECMERNSHPACQSLRRCYDPSRWPW
jgi:hypothetical protein